MPCACCGVLRRTYPTELGTAFCVRCVGKAKTCDLCGGPCAAYNRSGMCSRCRARGKS